MPVTLTNRTCALAECQKSAHSSMFMTAGSCSVMLLWPTRRMFSCHGRSEEHTSELQSRLHLVCRLLLEKKKTTTSSHNQHATQPSTPFPTTSPSHTTPVHHQSRHPTPPISRHSTSSLSTLSRSHDHARH